MMKLPLAFAAVLLLTGLADAAPDRMNFTGRIAGNEGPLEGPVAMTFRIYDAASDGAMLWEESHGNVPATNGLVFVELGSIAGNGLDETVFTGDGAYLEVSIDGETLTPRTPLLSVPYATRASRASRAAVADSADRLGTLGPADVAPAAHGHAASEIAGTFGSDQIACYADLVSEGALDGNAATDLVTHAQGDTRYLNVGEMHAHGAADITGGTLHTNRFDAYADLAASNYLNNSSPDDLLTQGQLDGRYLRSGNASRVYGCGSYVLANFCPAGNTTTGPNCDDVPAGSFCEADGECGLSTVGNCGTGAWYFKRNE